MFVLCEGLHTLVLPQKFLGSLMHSCNFSPIGGISGLSSLCPPTVSINFRGVTHRSREMDEGFILSDERYLHG